MAVTAVIRVAAAGINNAADINNTDVNTRIGWYSKAVSAETGRGGTDGFEGIETADATRSGTPLQFPRVHGADVCARIAAVGEGVSAGRTGQRVLVRTMLRSPVGFRPFEIWTFGSECDGGFAQYTVAPSRDTYAVESDLSDEELAVPAVAGPPAHRLPARPVTARLHLPGRRRLREPHRLRRTQRNPPAGLTRLPAVRAHPGQEDFLAKKHPGKLVLIP